MPAQEAIRLLSRRAHALRTATAANFTARRRSLAAATTQVASEHAAAAVSGQWTAADVERVGTALRAASNTYRRQRAPGSGSGGVIEKIADLFTTTPSAAEQRAAAADPKRAQRQRAPARERQRAPARDDTDDYFGGEDYMPAAVGLLAAIGRTVSGNVGPAGLAALWSPPGPLLQRPAFKLFLAGSFLAFGVAGLSYAASKQKKVPPRVV